MQKILLFFLFFIIHFSKTHAQANNSVSPGVNIPIGEFAQTHIAGISADYSWSRHRLGELNNLPGKAIGFIADGGIDYYLGKKETVAGYEFKYGGYLYLHTFAGGIYNLTKKMNVSLTAGPTLGFHKGHTDFGFGVNWRASYYFSEKIAITPGLIYMKHKEANALWSISIKATDTF